MLRRLIGEDVELMTKLAEGLASVRVDPGQMEQVLINLAVNARDAMPEGGRLTIETGEADLDQAYAATHPYVQPGRHVVLAVSDTGTGMDAKTRSRVFEPFFTTKEAGKGTGLGLSTVYGIVKQSGGYITVYSEPGLGTTFRVCLPAVVGAGEAVPEPREDLPPKRGSETILVAEDEESIRRLACRMLEGFGYRALPAAGSEEALRLCERHEGPIDLILTDVVLPGMGGPDLAWRAAATRPSLKVLFMSGYTDESILQRGMLEIGTAFLQKPFTPNALARKVREVLDMAGRGTE